ncbi:MAG: biotin transporter BioY [Anaerolineales bacterium]
MTTIAPTLSARVLPRTDQKIHTLVLVSLGAMLLALLAQVRIVLPFTPVPVTGQTLGVLLIGAALGMRKGAASVSLYLALGLAGLPVFTGSGAGISHLIGATGGYLLGFILAAALVGWLAERGYERSFRTALLPFLAGTLIIYLCGALWLAAFVGSLSKAVALGVTPFLVGDTLKLLLAGGLLPAAWRLVK